MNLGALRAYTRSNVLRDVPLPRAWSDPDLDLWLNEAQDRIARDTQMFLDSESPMAQFSTVAGTAVYTLDPRVLAVRAMTRDGLRALSKAVFAGPDSRSGPPRCWMRRLPTSIVLWPNPDAVYNIQMFVARLPLAKMEVESDVPEVPDPYHTTLCLWAGLQALLNTDTQGANKVDGITKSLEKRWGTALVEIGREVYQQNRGW